MPDVTATRTLVKSAPELWTECSDAASLSRHLDCFGEIRITRLEPETAVAWEGEHASGTVRLEPSGWGTRVVLTATPNPSTEVPPPASEPAASVAEEPALEGPDPVPGASDAAPEPPDLAPEPGLQAPDSTPEPALEASDSRPAPVLEAAEPAPAKGFFARLRSRFGRGREEPLVIEADPVVEVAPMPEAEPLAEVAPMPEVAPSLGVTPDLHATPDPPAPGEPLAPAPNSVNQALDPQAALDAALESLGQAHHRPFSRA